MNLKTFANRLAKIPKTLYDGRVRKVFLGILLFFIITILFSHRPLRAQSPSCTAMTCEKNGETCASPCEGFVCDKRLFGAGKCVDKATFCPKLIVSTNCLLKHGSADCRDGSKGCENYFCWPDKLSEVIGSGKCTLGLPPSTLSKTPTPTPTPPLPPCSQWANLQGTPIPIQEVGSRKDIKCIAIQTGIGNISTEPAGFVKRIFSLVLGLAGGIALILIIISGYRIMFSQGNPETLASGRGQLVGAIVGLLFIILSFVILQVIGVDILKIPGFQP